jgi:hypothetical protein
MVDILLFLAAILFIIPFFVQLRIYYLVKSRSYLAFSLLFVSIFVDTIISAFQLEGFGYQALLSLSFVLTNTILILISLDAVNNKFPIKSRSWISFSVFILLGTLVLKYLIRQDILASHYTSLRIVFGEILELSTGIVILYAFSHINLILQTSRTIRIRRLWMAIALVLIFNALAKIIFYTLYFFFVEFGGSSADISRIVMVVESIITINVLIIATITFLFAVFFPETLLLSKYQFYRAYKIYQMLENQGVKDGDRPRFFPEEIILDYLSTLPKELFKDRR